MNTMTRAASAAAGVLAVGAGGLAYASLVERNAFTLRRFSVPVLPPGAAPLRVLHLSDLHLMPGQTRKIEWVRRLAALEPDLVVNTGDNLAHLRGRARAAAGHGAAARAAGRLRPRLQRLLRARAQEPRALPHPPATHAGTTASPLPTGRTWSRR